MISDLFNGLSNPTLFDYLGAFNEALGGYFIFGSLLTLLVVLGISAFNWSNDLVGSFLNASYVVSIVGFLLSLGKTSLGVRVFSFEQETFFIVVTALLFVAKKIGD